MELMIIRCKWGIKCTIELESLRDSGNIWEAECVKKSLECLILKDYKEVKEDRDKN